ncbi:MAG: DUF1697 domain-containing protein [Salinibacterium sp.]|nr:MAG: DUF1697 domain-containing protein [Salinibacterium sp.]
MPEYAAFLRGINVGPTTRVPMQRLRQIFVDSGFPDARTLLNSGNVVFSSSTPPAAAELEGRIAKEIGVATTVVILEAPRLRRIVDAVPFEGDESKLVVALMNAMPTGIRLPERSELMPELVELGADAVYQWLPEGVSNSKLKSSFWKQFPPETTARNVRTLGKVLALLEEKQASARE